MYMMTRLEPAIAHAFAGAPETATWGVSALDLITGQPKLESGTEDEIIEAASLTELAITHVVHLKGIPEAESMHLQQSDIRAGDGVLMGLPEGYELAISQIVHQCLSRSDNTAARMLVRRLGGPLAVNEVLAESPLGLSDTWLAPEPQPDESLEPAVERFSFGTTTAREIAKLHRRALEDPLQEWALEHGHHLEGLRGQLDKAHLLQARSQQLAASALYELHQRGGKAPEKVYEWLLTKHAPRTAFPNKIGNYDGRRHDVARIGETVVAVLFQDTGEQRMQTARQIALAAQRAIGHAAFQDYLHGE